MTDMWWFCHEYGNDKIVLDSTIHLAGSWNLQSTKERATLVWYKGSSLGVGGGVSEVIEAGPCGGGFQTILKEEVLSSERRSQLL